MMTDQRQYERTMHLLPQDATALEVAHVVAQATPQKQTIGWSMDDAFITAPQLTARTVVVWDVERVAGGQAALEAWVTAHYPPLPAVQYEAFPPVEPPAFLVDGFDAPVGTVEERAGSQLWPGKWTDATGFLAFYRFGSNKQYSAWHTGADLNLNSPSWNLDKGQDVYAAGHGLVTYAQIVPKPSTWGGLVVIRHERPNGQVIHTRSAHMATLDVKAGEFVTRGQKIGAIGGSEYGVADHLHWDVSLSGILEADPRDWPGTTYQRVVDNYVDPKGFLLGNRPSFFADDGQVTDQA